MDNSHDNLKTNLAAIVNEAYCLVAIPLGMLPLPWRLYLDDLPQDFGWEIVHRSELALRYRPPGLAG